MRFSTFFVIVLTPSNFTFAGRLKAGTPIDRKNIITPSSWREGQRITESILGPTVKHPKTIAKTNAPSPKRTCEDEGGRGQAVVPRIGTALI